MRTVAALADAERQELEAEHARHMRSLEALHHDIARSGPLAVIREQFALNRRMAAIERLLFEDIEARGGKRTYWWSRPKGGKR